ncbi:MAG: 4-(cytidine 5'-diphospho)-2-C-methyl-D-erythritol kinase [Myxococcota bacterium]
MRTRVELRAPAKINLGLALVGLRADGYHLLESVFAPIALYDELVLEVGSATPPGHGGAAGDEGEIVLVCGPPLDPGLPVAVGQVPDGPDNLAWRAARLFRDRAGIRAPIRIALRKGIPAGAGLGGGSSDAAAVLEGMRRLTGASVVDAELARWALDLGADVPFFLARGPAFVAGIGERIAPLPGLPSLPIVLVNPGKTLATADVYREADRLGAALTKERAGSTMRALSGLTQNVRDVVPALRDLLINDLEPAARRLCPAVAQVADRLDRAGAVAVSLTGSGATVFGVFASQSEAERAAARIADDDAGGGPERCWVRATRTLAS